ncbi:MAG: Asp-tRNA(Asn)/Glu-tRNA(Gln) amidotransferase subunit GatA [Deltaproteobacteria bacterium]|nr:Asp-tRNA(Asn)/Glu-tRNA(Gln) amidotransferase subunit GatA [Deltaproteobacteria bacterium]MBW2306078.1 Asp-tRNA(Asn)/Glu-tRNA(Gln) amidotransferase subunit GatA [Deltaproteobacteria bacterium]
MAKLDTRTTTISSLSELIRKKELSPVEVIEAFLERIEAVQPKINAFITILEKEARQAARAAEEEIVRGRYRSPLHGIPLAPKDLFFTAGVKTTCGSRILADFIPDRNATVVSRLVDAGAILIGKTNMHEFAFGPTSLNNHYGHPGNPWSPGRMTGGSSGGSAAALAGSCALLTLGTDTGGSIRIPAALCGIVGIKPTFGRVSKYGVYPLCWSLDHPGPMTRSVSDVAIALGVMAGRDPKDPCTRDVPVPDYLASLTGDIKGVRVGVPDTFYFEQIDPEVKAVVEKAVNALKDLGAEVMPVHIPDLHKAAAATLIILSTEAAACLEKFHRTRPNDIGDDVRARLDAGALHLATNYVKAQRFRRRVQENFARVFMRVDVLATPGVSITAPGFEESSVRLDGKDVPVIIALPYCTRIYNLIGLPSVSIPVGFSGAGLPIGMQIAGRPFNEEMILRVAHAYERDIYQAPPWPALT